MKAFHRGIVLAVTLAMMGLPFGKVGAENFPRDEAGYGYTEVRNDAYLSPGITVGAIVLIAFVAILLQDKHGHAVHSHHVHCQ